MLDQEEALNPAELQKSEIKRERVTEPPAVDNQLSANTEVEAYSPATEELVKPKHETPILSHDEHVLLPEEEPALPQTAETPDIDAEGKTLSDLEEEVNSPHLHASDPVPAEFVDDARNAVNAAFSAAPPSSAPEPLESLNAQPLGEPLHYEVMENEPAAPAPVPSPTFVPAPGVSPAVTPPSVFPAAPVIDPEEDGKPAPPPVPPPLIPPQ